MKRTKLASRLVLPVSLAVCFMAAAFTSPATAQDQENEWNKQYRSNYEVPLGHNYTGRSPYMRSHGKAPPPPAPVMAPAPAPRPAPSHPCSAITTGPIHMTKQMPAEVGLGKEFMYELNLQSAVCSGHVVVSDHVPAGATFVKSDPPAQVDGDHLVWNIHEMEHGEARKIKVWLRADREGTLASCALVSADPRVCASTLVGRPMLAIRKTGPESALLGADVTYNIVVNNPGTFVARNVVVTDPVPSGLKHASGQNPLTFRVGDLGPNQSRTIPVTFKADQRGKVCNVATADGDNVDKVNAEACTVILKPGLKIVKTGDREQFLEKTASYQIVVSNTGDTTLTRVTVTDTAPSQTKIDSASGATVSGNTATWNLGDLKAGENRTLNLTLTSETPGNHCNSVSVASAEGLRDSSEACTLWKGISALLITLVDDPDPIQIGESITYTIRVTNQGTADDTNVKVTAEFPSQITPVSSPEGRVEGQRVVFPAVARLAPKQSFTYTIKAKGAAVGDARINVVRTSDIIPAPTTVQESTRVY